MAGRVATSFGRAPNTGRAAAPRTLSRRQEAAGQAGRATQRAGDRTRVNAEAAACGSPRSGSRLRQWQLGARGEREPTLDPGGFDQNSQRGA
jgi:hypothetical protein